MKLLKNSITRQAILFTMLIFVVYRLGIYITTPLINGEQLSQIGSGSAVGIFNFLGGGNLTYFSLFALGVSPYITASIVIQLLESDLIPSVAEWKHQGIEGQNKRYNWTKYLAIIFAYVQSLGLLLSFYSLSKVGIILPIKFTPGSEVQILEFFVISLFMTAGTAALIWLADRITEKGIGNGMSVIIMAGILSRIPMEIQKIYQNIYDAAYNGIKGLDTQFYLTTLKWGIVFIIFLILVIAIIYYTLAYRKVNINYVKNSNTRLSSQNYIPIKLNPAGVIPIIFVSPIMQLPLMILNLKVFSENGIGTYETIVRAFFDMSGTYWPIALVLYIVLIISFSIIYSYIQMNPEQMAENLEKQSGYVVGVRPGKDTEDYLTNVINKTTIYGGIFLAILATLPIVLQNVLQLPIGLQLIGTGLIITVNVLVQTYQSMENKTESKNYKRLFNFTEAI